MLVILVQGKLTSVMEMARTNPENIGNIETVGALDLGGASTQVITINTRTHQCAHALIL